MQQMIPPPRDPAPSRIAYRVQRLWLTPFVRTALRVGLPVFLILFAFGIFFADQSRRDAVSSKIAEIRRSIEERPEFMVKLMAIDGASEDVGEDIREVLAIDFPVSSFELDLPQMRQTLEDLDAVAKADILIRSNVLQLKIEERLPAVVWRGRRAIELLDSQGFRVAELKARGMRPDLPLIAGEGAEKSVPEALALLRAAGPISKRVRGLVRMGERRWDIVLDRDQRILLPEADPIAALERVIALDTVQDMLARDLVVVDMRNKNRPTIRLAEQAADQLRQASGLAAGAAAHD